MKTLTPVFTTEPNGDAYTVLWDGETVGKIDFNITNMQWEYSRYSQYPEVVVKATPEECIEAARYDCANAKPEPVQAVVTHIAGDAAPAYLIHGASWRTHGPGYEREVTVQVGEDVYEVMTPTGFARKLSPGKVVELAHDTVYGLFLRWPKKPVKKVVLGN